MTQTKSVTITTSPHKALFSYGHIIWWTIKEGIYDTQPIQDAAKKFKLPKTMLDFLVGVGDKDCWEKATNLNTQPLQVREDVRTRTKFSYTTRGIDSKNRLLVREILDSANVKLATDQVGLLSFDNGFCFTPDPFYFRDQEIRNEVDSVVKELKDRYSARVGQIDGAKVRKTLQRWLEYRHRVSVRGNGGVYYVPNRKDENIRNEIIGEITHICEWLTDLNIGTLTSFEIFDTPTSSSSDLISSAVEEIKEEIKLTEEALQKYTNSAGMNAGSRAQSAKSQVERMKELDEKIQALSEALGDKIGALLFQVKIVSKRASKMMTDSLTEVDEERIAKGKSPKQATSKQPAKLKVKTPSIPTFDVTKAAKKGTLVALRYNENNEEEPFQPTSFDPAYDWALVYPDGKFKKVIIDEEEWKDRMNG